MNTYLQKIKDAVYSSSLSIIEQEELTDLFSRASDSELEGVATLITKDSSMIKVLSDNYQSKQAALTSGDPELWKKLLTEEQALLAEHAKQTQRKALEEHNNPILNA